MVATIIGIFFIIAGFWGVLRWFGDFMLILRGIGPVSVLIGGCVALVAGVSSLVSRPLHEKKK